MEELAKKPENTSRKRSKSTGGTEAKKRKTAAGSEGADPSLSSSSLAGSSSNARQSSRSAAATYSGGKEGESESEINSDECCVCYRMFQREGTGLEWVQWRDVQDCQRMSWDVLDP